MNENWPFYDRTQKKSVFGLTFFYVFDINIHSGTLIFMSLDGFYVSFLVIMTIVHKIFNYVLYTWDELQQNSQFIQHKNLWVHNNDSKTTIILVHLLKVIVANFECLLVEEESSKYFLLRKFLCVLWDNWTAKKKGANKDF